MEALKRSVEASRKAKKTAPRKKSASGTRNGVLGIAENRESRTMTTQQPQPSQVHGPHKSRECGARSLASKSLTNDLQWVLVDLIELHLQGKQAHWNVVGQNFRDLHLQLDEIVDAAREFNDAIAERLRALHASVGWALGDSVHAPRRSSQYPHGELDSATVIDLITARLDAVVATARNVHDDVDKQDPTSADLLRTISRARLERSCPRWCPPRTAQPASIRLARPFDRQAVGSEYVIPAAMATSDTRRQRATNGACAFRSAGVGHHPEWCAAQSLRLQSDLGRPVERRAIRRDSEHCDHSGGRWS